MFKIFTRLSVSVVDTKHLLFSITYASFYFLIPFYKRGIIEVSSLECEALTQAACDLRLMEWGKVFSFQKMIRDVQATMKESLIP